MSEQEEIQWDEEIEWDTPKQPTRGLSGLPHAAAGGFNVGLANTLGLPVDIMNKLQSLILPTSPKPFLGSEWIKQNIMPTPMKPEGFAETTAQAIGEQVPYAMSSALLPGATIPQMAKFAAGAGTGSGLARTIAPDNPYVDLAGQLVGGAGIPAIKTLIQRMMQPQNVGQVVQKGMEKGIKPSVINKSTASQAQRYMDQAKVGVETIIENKPNLHFIDETGTAVKGELPKNLREFSQSIEQTRREIFKEYHALSTKGGKTIGLDLNPIADELEVIAKDTVIRREAPATAKYAKERAARYRNQAYNPEEAEQAIAVNNRRLEVMPIQADANNAWVDKLINDNLRRRLDSLIEGAVGPNYQLLKNKYGALKTIEKDVTHRAMIDARKNQVGIMDLPNVFTGFEAIRGILSGNPSMLAAAAGAKGISSYMKWLTNPNRYVKSMFSNTEKILTQPQQTTPLAKATPPSMINLFQFGQRMEE